MAMDQHQLLETMDSLLDQREFLQKLKTLKASLAVFGEKYEGVAAVGYCSDAVTLGKVATTTALFTVCLGVGYGVNKYLGSWTTPACATLMAASLPSDDYVKYKMSNANTIMQNITSLHLSDKYKQDIEQLQQMFANWERLHLKNTRRIFVGGTGILASSVTVMAGEYLKNPKMVFGAGIGALMSIGYLFWAALTEKTYTEEEMYWALEKNINDLLGKYKLEKLYPTKAPVDV